MRLGIDELPSLNLNNLSQWNWYGCFFQLVAKKSRIGAVIESRVAWAFICKKLVIFLIVHFPVFRHSRRPRLPSRNRRDVSAVEGVQTTRHLNVVSIGKRNVSGRQRWLKMTSQSVFVSLKWESYFGHFYFIFYLI